MWKKCTPLWREAHFEVKMYKTHHARTTFGSCDVEKVHAVVARSTCRSQNVQKHHMFAPLLEVQISKKRTLLWREAHAQNTRGPDHFWKFGCRKSARRCGAKTFPSKNAQNTGVRTTFGGSDVASLQYTTLQDITLHYATLTTLQLHNYTALHSTTLNYTTLRYTTLNYTTLHYTTLHSTTLHYTTLHYLPLHFITLHYTTLHYTTTTQLHSTTLNYTTLH